MYGYIYKITNLLNNKIYIGKHKFDKLELDNKYITGGVLINRSIDKNGIENFKREIIDSSATCEEELNKLEIFYINKYNCRFPNGYNLAPGGEGVSDVLPITRKNMSKAAKVRSELLPPPSQKGKVWVTNGDEEHLISKSLVEEYTTSGYYLGRKQDIEKTLRAREKYKTGVYVHNEEGEIYISQDSLDKYIELGYSLGKIPYSEERRKHVSDSKKGAIAITDGVKNYYIRPEQLSEYIARGYHKGTYQAYNKSRLSE